MDMRGREGETTEIGASGGVLAGVGVALFVYRRWQGLLATLDPSRTLAGQLPTLPAGAPREQLRAQFRKGRLRKGKLRLSADFAGLSPEERRAHLLAAAIVAGSPGGRQKLEEFETSEPAVAAHVMRLLGIESPTSPQVQARRHLAAGEEHFKNKRFEDAGREYQKAVDLDPDNALALLYLGDTTYARGSYDLAQAYFGESLAIAPSPQAFRFLGDAIVHADGSLARARGCYEEALRLDPSYGGAKAALAQLHDLEREVRPRVTDRALAGTAIVAPPPLGWSDAWTPPRPSASSRPGQAGDRGIPPVNDPSDNPAQSAGDQLARIFAEAEPHGAAAAIDDDRAFSGWLAAASPDEITWAIMMVGSVAFQYMAKDRDLSRWEHWASREVQLAEALPADFGPDQAPEIGRDRFLADAYSARARVLYSQGRLPEAREWLERAAASIDAEQDARNRLGLPGESGFDRDFRTSDPRGEVLHNLAIISRDLGDVAASSQYAALAGRAMEERPTTESLIAAAIEQGNAAIDRDPDTALSAFHWALDHAEENPNQYTSKALATSMNSLGRCHHRLGLHRSALEYFNRARRLNEQARIAARLTEDFLGIGRVYRDRPDLGDAREALEQSLINASVPTAASDELAWPASDGSMYRVTDAHRAWESLLELGGLLEQHDALADASAVLDVATQLADVARASAVDDAHRVAIANQRIEAFDTLTRVHCGRPSTGAPRRVQRPAWHGLRTRRCGPGRSSMRLATARSHFPLGSRPRSRSRRRPRGRGGTNCSAPVPTTFVSGRT
jgi:tetratricopeptide (TPR) repeat protein